MFRRRQAQPTKPARLAEVGLEGGGWFDIGSSIELIGWKSYAPPALTRYRLLRTRNGSLVLEYPEPSVILAGIRTSDRNLYRSITAQDACAVLIDTGQRAEAQRLFSQEYEVAADEHRGDER